MFETLTSGLKKIFDKISGHGVITESQIDLVISDIKASLLEADVALPVVNSFILNFKEKAKGQAIIKSVSPVQMIIKLLYDELVYLLSQDIADTDINLKGKCPVNLLMVGLQGSGKTTAAAKLALKLSSEKRKVLLVSLDTYRPAAQEQLKILSESIFVDCLSIVENEKPIEITKRAIKESNIRGYDVVIFDTAGRLQIDEAMLEELVIIKKLIDPLETLLLLDAMTGQDAIHIASSFDKKINITGVILSRIDGDARGGCALSVKYMTGKPIKFFSSGEKLEDFDQFNAKSIASRILDKDDILLFVQKAATIINQKEVEQTAKKIQKGLFDLNDYIEQLRTIKKFGGFSSVLNILPSIKKLTSSKGVLPNSDKLLAVQESIVLSMTKKERRYPDILNASRKKRIANGSGTTVNQVNNLLKQFKQVNVMMKKVTSMDQKSLMRSSIGKFLS